MVIQKLMRTCKEKSLLFDNLHLIRLRTVTNWIFLQKRRPLFLRLCASCSELPSDISTMFRPFIEIYQNFNLFIQFAERDGAKIGRRIISSLYLPISLSLSLSLILSFIQCNLSFFSISNSFYFFILTTLHHNGASI